MAKASNGGLHNLPALSCIAIRVSKLTTAPIRSVQALFKNFSKAANRTLIGASVVSAIREGSSTRMKRSTAVVSLTGEQLESIRRELQELLATEERYVNKLDELVVDVAERFRIISKL